MLDEIWQHGAVSAPSVQCFLSTNAIKGGRGGAILWHFNVAWEISGFKLTAKFPAQNSGLSANLSYTTSIYSTHCGLWRG